MKIEKIQQCKEMCSVLMIDDEIHLTDNYKGIANSAQEAIKSFGIDRYDIIFTDLNMPIVV